MWRRLPPPPPRHPPASALSRPWRPPFACWKVSACVRAHVICTGGGSLVRVRVACVSADKAAATTAASTLGERAINTTFYVCYACARVLCKWEVGGLHHQQPTIATAIRLLACLRVHMRCVGVRARCACVYLCLMIKLTLFPFSQLRTRALRATSKTSPTRTLRPLARPLWRRLPRYV